MTKVYYVQNAWPSLELELGMSIYSCICSCSARQISFEVNLILKEIRPVEHEYI